MIDKLLYFILGFILSAAIGMQYVFAPKFNYIKLFFCDLFICLINFLCIELVVKNQINLYIIYSVGSAMGMTVTNIILMLREKRRK